jgi:hypothetical protein
MPISTAEIYQFNCLPHNNKNEALISFSLPEKSKVLLNIYNEQDSEVRLLINEYLQPAAYEVNFLYGNLAAGSYYIKLIVQTENIVDINSIIIQIP